MKWELLHVGLNRLNVTDGVIRAGGGGAGPGGEGRGGAGWRERVQDIVLCFLCV